MSGSRPAVAAVIVGINDRDWLEPALTSLQFSDGQGDQFDLQVYYVDNASVDASADVAHQVLPTAQVVRNATNVGFAAANNVAIRQALAESVDFVFLVNPDTWTPRPLIGQLLRFMQDQPQYGIVGPLQWAYTPGETDGEPTHNPWTKDALLAGERHVLHLNRPELKPPRGPATPRAPRTLEHAYVQGAALFARADMLRRIGIFDEMYHSFYEETDLCRRARVAGWRVALLADLGIYHRGAGGGASTYRRLQMMRNKYYFLLTDIDLAWRDAAAVAAGWLRRDLAGNGVGGHSSRPRAWLEVARSALWLASRLTTVLIRRRSQRILRANPRSSPPADRITR